MKKLRFILILLLCVLEMVFPDSMRAQFGDSWGNWELIPYSDYTRGIYPIVVSDTAGNIHLVYSGNNNLIFYTRFDGENWTQPVDILIGDGLPALALDSYGKLHIVYLIYGQMAYSWAPVARAAEVNAWSKPFTFQVYPDATCLSVDSSGAVHIAYILRNQNPGAYYTRSTDGGLSWISAINFSAETELQNGGLDSQAIQILADPAERLHIFWANKMASRMRYTRSLDSGETWSAITEIDPSREGVSGIEGDKQDPHLFARTADEIHMIWYARGEDGGSCARYHQWSRDGGESWTTPERILNGMTNCVGRSGMALDGDNRLHITSSGRGVTGTPDLHHYHSYWTGNEWSFPELINKEGEECPNLAIINGNLLVAFACGDRIEKPELFYMTRISDATYISPKPIPTVQIETISNGQSNIVRETAISSLPSATSQPNKISPVSANPIKPTATPILIGAISVIILILAIMLARLRHN